MQCDRCLYRWIPRLTGRPPIACPRCAHRFDRGPTAATSTNSTTEPPRPVAAEPTVEEIVALRHLVGWAADRRRKHQSTPPEFGVLTGYVERLGTD
jgi:hypothetical protein